MNSIRKIIALVTSILLVGSLSTNAFATEVLENLEDYHVLQVNDEVDMLVQLDIQEPRDGEYVYANAHGWFVYTGTSQKISQYGFDVAFKVTNNTSSVNTGGYVNAYHNSSVSNFTGLYETSFSGEGTGNCAVTGTFNLINTASNNAMYTGAITLELEITSSGNKTMHVSGNYDQWDVIWG